MPLVAVLPFSNPARYRGRRLLGLLSLDRRQARRLLGMMDDLADSRKRGTPEVQRDADGSLRYALLPGTRASRSEEMRGLHQWMEQHPSEPALMQEASLEGRVEPVLDGSAQVLVWPDSMRWLGWTSRRQRLESPSISRSLLVRALAFRADDEERHRLWQEALRWWPEVALDWMEGWEAPLDSTGKLSAPIQGPEDLLPLLRSEKSSIRLRALTLAGRLGSPAPSAEREALEAQLPRLLEQMREGRGLGRS